MKPSVKARRFLTEAAGDLNSIERGRLLAWLEQSGEQDLSSTIVQLALHAFERYERTMARELAAGVLDEDRKADLMNDIAFTRSVMSDLQHAKGNFAHAFEN